MRYTQMTVGSGKTQRQMWDIPVWFADEKLLAVVPPADLHDGVPGDCERCAIALGLKRQLKSPGVRIGSCHAYVALPMNGQGVFVEGYEGSYGVFAYKLSAEARRIVDIVDKEEVEEITTGAVVMLLPFSEAARKYDKDVKLGRNAHKKPRARPTIEQGVRNYAGRVWA